MRNDEKKGKDHGIKSMKRSLRKLTAKWDNINKAAEGICRRRSLYVFVGISTGHDPLETLAGISAESFLFRMTLRWKTLPAGDVFLGQRGCISAS
jgi:hypothetical protein